MSNETTQEGNRALGEEQDRNEEAYWAQHDPQVEQLYGGEWVVAYQRRIVAHGTDPAAVLQEAARVTQRRPEELVVCAIPHPDSWLADA